MNIGVIGVGHIGGTLAEKFVKAGHQVSVANSRGKEAVRAFAEKIGAAPSDISEIVKGKDVVILAVPLPAIEKIPRDLFKDAGKTIVVDTSNYYPDLRDSHIKELDEGKTESLWVSEKIGHPIIKAFNNVLGDTLAEKGRKKGDEGRLAAAAAGDSAEDKAVVMRLIDEAGFDPVDGGTLEESWRQQPGTPCYCCDYNKEEMEKALQEAVLEKRPAYAMPSMTTSCTLPKRPPMKKSSRSTAEHTIKSKRKGPSEMIHFSALFSFYLFSFSI